MIYRISDWDPTSPGWYFEEKPITHKWEISQQNIWNNNDYWLLNEYNEGLNILMKTQTKSTCDP